jgi:hypothetical protein
MKILIDEEVVKQALATLEGSHPSFGIHTEMWSKSVTALRSVLDNPTPPTNNEIKVRPPVSLLMTLFERYAAQRIIAHNYGNKHGDVDASEETWRQFKGTLDVALAPANTDELREAARAVVEWYDSNDVAWIPDIDRLRKALE